MEIKLNKQELNREKVLLVLLPFWTPLIPPLGIACLKSYLQLHHWEVKAVDLSVDTVLGQFYEEYFNTLRKSIPEQKRGNFYSIGHDVLRNHMMAYLNYTDKTKYLELLKILVRETFYEELDDILSQLDQIIAGFYIQLQEFFINLLEREKPSVLGLSVYSGSLPASMFAAKLTREKYPHVKIVMGGGVFADQLAIGTPNFDLFLEKTGDYVDKMIIGEGEILFLKYVRGELPESQKVFTLNDINWEILDLNEADVPDFSDFNRADYPLLGAYTSRSCPFQCSFCSETIQWGKYRKKSPGKIIAELTDQYRKYNCQLFFMSDSLLNPVITDLAGEFVKSDTSIYWDGCIRADERACDTATTLLWRKGGFYRARLGLESGSPRVLDIMNKKITRTN